MKIEFEIKDKNTDHPSLWIVEAPFESKIINKKEAAGLALLEKPPKRNPSCTCYFNLPLGDGSVLRIPYPC